LMTGQDALRNGATFVCMGRSLLRADLPTMADLILVDLNTIAFTPLNDLRRQLVFSENGSSVVMTMVAGRVVCENGRLLTVDEEALKEEVRALVPEHRRELAQTAAAAAELNPYYREMYLRAAARDVGMHRWGGPMTP